MNVALQTPAPGLEQVVDYYETLGFSRLIIDDETWLTDGQVMLRVNADPYARPGIILYKANWAQEIEKLGTKVVLVKQEAGWLFMCPSGARVYLSSQEMPKPNTGAPTSVLGNYAGISLETIAMKQCLAVWNDIGFSLAAGDEKQGWATLKNLNGDAVSIMKNDSCPHMFVNPSLTYFNGSNNLEVISNIKALGVPLLEEVTHFNTEGIVDNIVMCDPGGIGCFVFSD